MSAQYAIQELKDNVGLINDIEEKWDQMPIFNEFDGPNENETISNIRFIISVFEGISKHSSWDRIPYSVAQALHPSDPIWGTDSGSQAKLNRQKRKAVNESKAYRIFVETAGIEPASMSLNKRI